MAGELETTGQILAEMKKTHDLMMGTVTDLRNLKSKVDELEGKNKGVAEYKETLDKIDSVVEKHESKQEDLVKQYKALESKLTELEAMGGASKQSQEQKDAEEHYKEFKHWVRKGSKAGNEQKLEELQKKSMFAASDPDGGWAIPREMSNKIVAIKREATPFRSDASSTTVGGDMFKYMIDMEEMTATWVSERASRSNSNTPKMQEASIALHEMSCHPAVTQNMLDDSAFPVESWLTSKVAEAFGNLEAYSFLLGTGVGQPRGILTYNSGTTWNTIEQILSGADGAVTADQLIVLQDALKERYASGAKFYMNRRILTKVRLLKDDYGQYLWQPGLREGMVPTLLGDPVVKMNYLPYATDSLGVVYGNLREAYLIIDKYATRVLRDPFTQHPYVVYKTNGRVGGEVVNFEAIKLMKLGDA